MPHFRLDAARDPAQKGANAPDVYTEVLQCRLWRRGDFALFFMFVLYLFVVAIFVFLVFSFLFFLYLLEFALFCFVCVISYYI